MSEPDLTSAPLAFRVFGSAGSPPLFLLHGLYGDSSTVAPIARQLAANFRVIAPDALGHGRSARLTEFTLEDHGRALLGTIEALGYDAAAVVGISMGSYIAAQAAASDPSRVSHLGLVVTKAHGVTSSTVAYAERHGFDLAGATLEESLAFMAGALWSPDTDAERRGAILGDQTGQQIELTAAERAAIDHSLAGFDLRPSLGSISADTIVISGASDGLNPPEAGEEVAALIPHARFVVYGHSGHMLAYEETDRLVADVEELTAVRAPTVDPVPAEAGGCARSEG